MTKTEALAKLAEEMAVDASLPLRESNLVFGEGDPDAGVIFIGEAPGFHENEQRRPFVGRAGQLLNKLLAEIGWRREQVYITNIVKRRPPDNRDPEPAEIEAYKPWLAKQIEILKPKIIATLGRFSMNYFLPQGKITRDEGKLFKAGNFYLYPLFHPAAALRNPATLDALRASFARLPAALAKVEELIKVAPSPEPTTTQERLF